MYIFTLFPVPPPRKAPLLTSGSFQQNPEHFNTDTTNCNQISAVDKTPERKYVSNFWVLYDNFKLSEMVIMCKSPPREASLLYKIKFSELISHYLRNLNHLMIRS